MTIKRLLLLLALCLLAPLGANAAMRSVLQVTTSGAAPPPYTGPGDAALGANADMFFSLRGFTQAIATAGTQKLVNIVRASDSHACDVLVATTGGMGNTASCGTGGDNGQSASAFCASTTCAVATWYDQSGGNECTSAPCNATQATAANRPQLVFNCINTSLPCIQFVGSSSQWLQTAACNTGCPNTVTNAVMVVAERNGATTAVGVIANGSSGGSTCCIPSFTATANTAGAGNPSPAVTATANDNVWHIIYALTGYGTINSSTSTTGSGNGFVYVDGGLSSGGSVGSAGFATPFTIGGQNTTTKGNFLTGNVTEIWFLGNSSGTTFNTTALGQLCHNQLTFWGTTGTC